ncbi:hypothetical protein NB709_000563 [Xanthomonas sacchari]|nr:hypothetical protein [Xanthomonas sacchari]MCW0387307.1 hypothetical protein [Xanthomonas sacchari]MCW0402989.1 hypothetical protein [Xanthomonas sacchari]MCW0410687.1 hypothetical protein [Xanthomonas sacchari]MCW0414371.1 hypothetical protein [Xanthomonas sacchari]
MRCVIYTRKSADETDPQLRELVRELGSECIFKTSAL